MRRRLDRLGVVAGDMSGFRVSIELADRCGEALSFLGAASASPVGVLDLVRELVEIVNGRRRESEPGNDGLGQRFARLLRFLDDLGSVETRDS